MITKRKCILTAILMMIPSWIGASAYGVRRGNNDISGKRGYNNDDVPKRSSKSRSSSARSAIQRLQGGSTRIRRLPRRIGRDDEYKFSQLYHPSTRMHSVGASALYQPRPFHPQHQNSQPSVPISPPPPLVNHRQSSEQQTSKKKSSSSSIAATLGLSKVDLSVAVVYFCNAFAISLPALLTPMIGEAHSLNPSAITGFCATVASVSIMGGGLGKICNGIVCQSIGGMTTATNYMMGLGVCSLLLSLSTSIESVRWLVAGMEYFSSAMWAACSVILSNHHAKAPLKFARSITCLGLASNSGTIASKVMGSALLQVADWRKVAQFGAVLAIAGSFIVRLIVAKDVPDPKPAKTHSARAESLDIVDKVKSVVKSRLFWTIGIAHVSGYLAKTFDRVMGPFMRELTGLPHTVCGGLTASVTIGFVLGLMKVQSFYNLKSIPEKTKVLKKWYARAGLSFLGLAAVATNFFGSLQFNPMVTAGIIALCTLVLSSSVAFQFYQVPSMVSTVCFSENKAVCLAFIDGMAFFLTAPIWAASGYIVNTMGWSTTLGTLAVVFGLGSALMVSGIQPVLVRHSKRST